MALLVFPSPKSHSKKVDPVELFWNKQLKGAQFSVTVGLNSAVACGCKVKGAEAVSVHPLLDVAMSCIR